MAGWDGRTQPSSGSALLGCKAPECHTAVTSPPPIPIEAGGTLPKQKCEASCIYRGADCKIFLGDVNAFCFHVEHPPAPSSIYEK